MIRIAVIYWALLNFLNLVGGLIAWFQLKQEKERSAHYLSRILMAEALRAFLSLTALRAFRMALRDRPVFIVGSVIVITLLTGAIWGWILYTHKFWNGEGFIGFVKRLFYGRTKRG